MQIKKELDGTVKDQETFKSAMEQIEDEIEQINNRLKVIDENYLAVINDLHARISIMEADKNVE